MTVRLLAPRRAAVIFVAVLSVLPVVGCITEPGTGRWSLALITEDQATSMGVDAYRQILSESKLSNDTQQKEMLRRVGRRIAEVVDARMKEDGRKPFEWQFEVIDEPTVNAFALPGGKVAFYRGILDVCEDENGIAVVMGHEVAHAYLQHGRKRVSEQLVTQYGLAAVQAALSGDGGEDSELTGLTMAALGVSSHLGTLYFSRSDESAADEVGLELMAQAGFDPRASVAFWERMDRLSEGGEPLELLSTHPSHGTRIERLQEKMPEAVSIYEGVRASGG